MFPMHFKFINFIEQLDLSDVFLMKVTTTVEFARTWNRIFIKYLSNIHQTMLEYQSSYFLKTSKTKQIQDIHNQIMPSHSLIEAKVTNDIIANFG